MTRVVVGLLIGLALGLALPTSAEAPSVWSRTDVSRLVRALETIAANSRCRP